MLRRTLSLVALSLIAASCAPEMMGTNTYLGFRLDIASAPPPPRVRYYDEGPRIVAIPDSRVYYVDNAGCEMYQYDSSFYIVSGGYWYRSGSANGPFAVIDVHSVPDEVVRNPRGRWNRHPHGGPPGQMKKDRDRDHDHDNGWHN